MGHSAPVGLRWCLLSSQRVLILPLTTANALPIPPPISLSFFPNHFPGQRAGSAMEAHRYFSLPLSRVSYIVIKCTIMCTLQIPSSGSSPFRAILFRQTTPRQNNCVLANMEQHVDAADVKDKRLTDATCEMLALQCRWQRLGSE